MYSLQATRQFTLDTELFECGVSLLGGWVASLDDRLRLQIVAELFAMPFEQATCDVVAAAVTQPSFGRFRCSSHVGSESGQRERAAHVVLQLGFYNLLQVADHPDPLDHVQLALLVVDLNDDFHGDQRTDVLFEPLVIVDDIRLGVEQLHQLDGGSYASQTDGEKGQYDKAYDGNQLIPSDNHFAHNNLGVAYARQGKFSEAITNFSEALRLDPEHARAQKNLKIALQKARKAVE